MCWPEKLSLSSICDARAPGSILHSFVQGHLPLVGVIGKKRNVDYDN